MKKLFALCAWAILPFLAQAQTLTVNVISLTQSTPIDSMEVFLIGPKDISSNFTDMKGVVIFQNLDASAKYRVFIEDNNKYQYTASPELSVDGGKKYLMQVPDRMSASLGEVLITSSPMAKMNRQDATVSGQLKKEEFMKMPIEGRDVTRGLYRLPNVTQAVLGYAEGPNISINGLNGIFTNYLVDGMDNNERFLGNMKINTPVGFVENVTVLTNNYSAEWGNSSNGIVNVLSRSGTNVVTGEAFYLTRPGSVIDSPSDFAQRDLSGNLVKDGFQRHQFGFSVGAPIKKNKTFLYINAEQTIDIKDNLLNSPELDVNETVRGNNYFTFVNAKVDHIWSNKWRSSLRGQVGRIYIDRQGGGLEGGVTFPSAASAQDNDTYLIAFKNTGVINSRLSTEVNYLHSYFRWNYRQPVNPENPSVTLRDPMQQTIAVIGQAGSIFDDKEYTHQFQNKWFYDAGDHYIKAGVEFITSDFNLTGGGNPNGSYLVDLNEEQLAEISNSGVGSDLNVNDVPADASVFQYDVELRPRSLGRTQNVTSAYIEDRWSINNRLTANIGLRWDYDNLSKSGGTEGDWDNIAPRFSLNFQLTENSVIRGGYGIFYDKIKYSVYSDALQFSNNSSDFKAQLAELQRLGILDADADLDRITFEGNLQATAPDVDYLQGPTAEDLSDEREGIFRNNTRILNPNGWDNPYSHQFSVGYQYKPDNETLFKFDAVHTRTENLYVVRNLNVASPYLLDESDGELEEIARDPVIADASRPVAVASDDAGFYNVVQGDTLRGGTRNVFMTTSDGRAEYTALNFMLQKEVNDGKLGFRLLYTLSWTKSNTSSINTRAQDNNDFDAEYTWDENDRRHVLSAVTIYQPIKGLSISPTALIQSGQPVTRVADATIFYYFDDDGNQRFTGDLNGDGENFGLPADRWPGVDENTDRLPWAATFDISVKYLWSFGKANQGIEFSADVFNLFNAQNWSGYNTTRSVSNQAQVGPPDSYNYRLNSASPPRQFQFGARYIF